MKLLEMLPVSPKAAIVAISLLVPIALNYELIVQMFFAAPQSTTEGAIAQVSQGQTTQPGQSALDGLKRSAEGNVANQLKLAVKYSTGEGVVKDQAEASRWYMRAAEAGDVQAMYEVSLRHRHGYGLAKHMANSNVWRQRAAVGGHPEAAYEMARTYGTVDRRGAVISTENAADIAESSKQLVLWLARASEYGSLAAKHELALVRLFGIFKDDAVKTGYLVPLPSGTSSAIQLLTENAEAGYWQSQYALAELYQFGHGDIRPDLTESNKWWQRLDAQKDATVQLSIGRHFLIQRPEAIRDRRQEVDGQGPVLRRNQPARFRLVWPCSRTSKQRRNVRAGCNGIHRRYNRKESTKSITALSESCGAWTSGCHVSARHGIHEWNRSRKGLYKRAALARPVSCIWRRLWQKPRSFKCAERDRQHLREWIWRYQRFSARLCLVLARVCWQLRRRKQRFATGAAETDS